MLSGCVSTEHFNALTEYAARHDITRSEAMRRAIAHFLADADDVAGRVPA